MRQTGSLLRIRVSTLTPQVFASCCEPLLETGSSRRYIRNSFLRCLVLNPDGPTECSCLFLPRCPRPSLGPSQVGLPLYPRTRFFTVKFRGCHRTFLSFKPPSLLVSQIAPTAANFPGRPRLLLPGRTCFVASARTGYAIRLIQAIDGERDFHLSRFAALSAAPRTILHRLHSSSTITVRSCDLLIRALLQHTATRKSGARVSAPQRGLVQGLPNFQAIGKR